MEKRNCKYRNCDIDITSMRKDAKFCCRKCKGLEKIYVKRRRDLLKKYTEKDMLSVKIYKEVIDLIKMEKNDF